MGYRGLDEFFQGISMLGRSLQQIRSQKEEEDLRRLKNYYGDNIEAFRQDALKDEKVGAQYRKYVGDPSRPLPEDPKAAQQRQALAAVDKWRNQLDPAGQAALDAYLATGSSELSTYLGGRMPKPPEAPAQKDIIARQDKLAELYPNSTPLQRAELAQAQVTGTNPWQTTTTPGQVNPNLPFSALSPPVYDYSTQQISPSTYEAKMGETKPQIMQRKQAEEMKLKQQKFEQSQKNFDERMTQTKKNYQLALKSLNELVAYRGRTENRAEGSARRLEASAVAQKNATLLSGYRSLLVAAEREKSNALSQDDMDKAQTKIDQYNGEIMKIMAEIEAAKQQLKSGQTTPAPNPAPAPTGTPTPAPAKSSWADQMKQGAKQ